MKRLDGFCSEDRKLTLGGFPNSSTLTYLYLIPGNQVNPFSFQTHVTIQDFYEALKLLFLSKLFH